MIDYGDLKISEVEHIIDESVFSERDRKILKRRFIDNITFERIAEEVDMSDRQIKRIVYKYIKRIF